MRMFPPSTVLGLAVLSAAILTAAADSMTDGQPALKIAPAAPPMARPFRLRDVRLLEGEFKTGQDTSAKYLLSLEPDRLLAGFRQESALPKKAESYGGWESKSIAGHSLGHYLSACAMAWAATGNKEFLERVKYIVDWKIAYRGTNNSGFELIDIEEAVQHIGHGLQRAADADNRLARSAIVDLPRQCPL